MQRIEVLTTDGQWYTWDVNIVYEREGRLILMQDTPCTENEVGMVAPGQWVLWRRVPKETPAND